MTYIVILLLPTAVLAFAVLWSWRRSFYWERQAYKWQTKYECKVRDEIDHDWWRAHESH